MFSLFSGPHPLVTPIATLSSSEIRCESLFSSKSYLDVLNSKQAPAAATTTTTTATTTYSTSSSSFNESSSSLPSSSASSSPPKHKVTKLPSPPSFANSKTTTKTSVPLKTTSSTSSSSSSSSKPSASRMLKLLPSEIESHPHHAHRQLGIELSDGEITVVDNIVQVGSTHESQLLSTASTLFGAQNKGNNNNSSNNGSNAGSEGIGLQFESVDIVAPAENMKKVLSLPISSERVSMAVHRVGDTLVLDGDIAFVPPRPETSTNAERRRQKKRERAWMKSHLVVQEAVLEGNELSSVTSFVPPPVGHKIEWKDEDEADGSDNDNDNDGDGNDDTRAQVTPFRRYRRWDFQGLKTFVGSNLKVFNNAEHPAVSVALCDMNADPHRTRLTLFDRWLDNVIATVPEIAICWHRAGLIEKYQLLPTDQLPYLKHSWTPQAAEASGAQVLRWLMANCTRDTNTYWLYREERGSQLQLFDLQHVQKALAEAREQSERQSKCDNKEGDSKTSQGGVEGVRYNMGSFSYPVAILCYQMASQIVDIQSQEQRVRRRELLAKCIALLNPKDHSLILATAREQIADTFVCVHIRSEKDQLCPRCGFENVSGIESYTVQSTGAKGFVLPSSNKRHDCAQCVAHLSLGMTVLDDAGLSGQPLYQRLKRKAIQCYLFLAIVHLAKQGPTDGLTQILQYAFKITPKAAASSLCDLNTMSEEEITEHNTKGMLLTLTGDMYYSKAKMCLSSAKGDETLVLPSVIIGDERKTHEDGEDSSSRQDEDIDNETKQQQQQQQQEQEEHDHSDDKAKKPDENDFAHQNVVEEFSDAVKLLPLSKLSKMQCLQLAVYHYKASIENLTRDMDKITSNRKLGDAVNELAKLFLTQGMFQEAVESFQKAGSCFESVGDVGNAALIACNTAALHIHKAKRLDVDGTDTRPLSEEQLALFATAIETFDRARAVIGTRSVCGWAWQIVHREMASTFTYLATRLQHGAPKGVGGPQDPNLVSDLLIKALKLYEAYGDNGAVAIVHHRIATLYSSQAKESSGRIRLKNGAFIGKANDAINEYHKALTAAAAAERVDLIVQVRMALSKFLWTTAENWGDEKEALSNLTAIHRSVVSSSTQSSNKLLQAVTNDLWNQVKTFACDCLKHLLASKKNSIQADKMTQLKQIFRELIQCPPQDATGQLVVKYLRTIETIIIN